MEPTRPTLAFIPAQPYARLLDVLADRGHAREHVLASAGVGPESFARDAGYLSLTQMEALVTRARALEPGHGLSVEVGSRISLMSHGWLSVAALSAATVGDAIDVVAEHFALVSPLFEVTVRESGGVTAIRLASRWPLAPEIERYHTAAIGSSLQAHVPKLLSWSSLPSGLELDAARHELRGPTALAAVRLPLADPRVHGAALRRCQAELASRPDPSNTTATVRRVLLGSGPPFLDLVATAKRLATSSRSLRRRLRDEGTSFRAVLDEVRGMLADEWLDDPKRSITEIGLDLGYTDAANFTRAYRRANGFSPSVARKQRLGLSASA